MHYVGRVWSFDRLENRAKSLIVQLGERSELNYIKLGAMYSKQSEIGQTLPQENRTCWSKIEMN